MVSFYNGHFKIVLLLRMFLLNDNIPATGQKSRAFTVSLIWLPDVYISGTSLLSHCDLSSSSFLKSNVDSTQNFIVELI